MDSIVQDAIDEAEDGEEPASDSGDVRVEDTSSTVPTGR